MTDFLYGDPTSKALLNLSNRVIVIHTDRLIEYREPTPAAAETWLNWKGKDWDREREGVEY